MAGPYTHPDPVQNTHESIKVAEDIQSTGLVTAYVPHCNLLWHLVAPHPAEYWYEYDIAFLERSDALLRIPGESVGADQEIEYAHEHMIPVFYKVKPLLKWAKHW